MMLQALIYYAERENPGARPGRLKRPAAIPPRWRTLPWDFSAYTPAAARHGGRGMPGQRKNHVREKRLRNGSPNRFCQSIVSA